MKTLTLVLIFALLTLVWALNESITIQPVLTVPSAEKLSNVRNSNLLRVVDLTGYLTHETTTVVVENKGAQGLNEYYWGAEEPNGVPRLSFLQVKERRSESILDVTPAGWDFENSIRYYKVSLSRPLTPGENLGLAIEATYTSSVVPRPKSVSQQDTQFFAWQGNKYAWSLYETVKQKTKIKMPNSNIKTFTTDSEYSTKSANIITYGNYENTPAKSRSIVEVQYEFQNPAIAVKTLRRDLELSHWGGNLAIEDHMWLVNEGAELKGFFSRLQLQQAAYYKAPTHYLKDLTLELPYAASDVYYRDEIGNVSTSKLRPEKANRRSVLEMRPRYPILGGWEYNFNIGYNLPLGDYLRYDSSSGKYVFKGKFLSPMDDVVYHDVTVRVILPEGASDIDVSSPYKLVSTSVSSYKTYADTNIGRQMLELRLANAVDRHGDGDFYVTYSYSTGLQGHLRKPLAIGGAVFIVFLSVILLSRVEKRIGK